MTTGTQLASEVKFILDYSKWIEESNRLEVWEESVDRIMDMHRKHPKFQKAFEDEWFQSMFKRTTELYKAKQLVGSNRAAQFGGDPILKHNSKMYNCLASHCDRVEFFNEAMYWLMSGCGVGYSVQYRHVSRLPRIYSRTKGTKTFQIEDSIEGWSDCIGVLMSSYFDCNNNKEAQPHYSRFSQYAGYRIKFDYSLIRPKGAKISGGFKAPGPDGLKQSVERIEELIERRLKTSSTLMRPIDCYDVVCHMGDAVLSGGVRRSATICVFSPEDEEMIDAKSFENFNIAAGINPQRARSNNSTVFVRNETSLETFKASMKKTKDQGDPGFYFVDHPDQVPNPCVEIGMWPIAENGRTGWQGCNLCTGNGSKIETKEDFLEIAKHLSFIGTLQAAYTDFKYVAEETKMIFEREALLGVGICGWMASPKVLLNEENQREAAALVLEINEKTAKLIGINVAARATCCKPDGNTGVLFESPSGVHGDESETYFRLMQVNKNSEVAQYFEKEQPFMSEESVWSSTNQDNVLYFPVRAKEGAILKKDLVGIKQLEIVKSIQKNWVEYGTRVEACVQPFLRHNVSNTVQVSNWEEVENYLFENRYFFSGVSFLGVFGALDFKQAPFTPVKSLPQLIETYGNAAIFASGLIVDGLQYFDNDLWTACEATKNKAFKLEGTRKDVLLKKDWIRRAKQFAKRFCKGKIQTMIYCLKDVYLFHKWCEINREIKPIDFSKIDFEPKYTEADQLGSASCVGGACELPIEWLTKTTV